MVDDKVNLVEMLSRYIDLEHKGHYWLALCPFHDDTNPSFTVYENDDDNASRWHCWTCESNGGDVIDFVQRMEDCDFEKAKKLCTYEQTNYERAKKVIKKMSIKQYDNLFLSKRMHKMWGRGKSFETTLEKFKLIDVYLNKMKFGEVRKVLSSK